MQTKAKTQEEWPAYWRVITELSIFQEHMAGENISLGIMESRPADQLLFKGVSGPAVC